jgi:hypothetical protein|tara:strand:- start:73 stop:687 length:615 start_codon:yes stop_codon:yes gene_type:complete
MKNEMNRETYLNKVIDKAVPLFNNSGFKISDIRSKLKVSCSFIEGLRSSSKNAVGAHYNPSISKDGFHEIMLSPKEDNSQEIIGTLIHEMVHAIQTHLYHDNKGRLNVGAHGKEFRKIALAVGLCGKMKSTISSPELIKTIDTWIKELGNYPHSKITLSNRKKQTTRNIKVECYDCKWSFRCSTKNVELMAFQKCLCCGNDSLI